MFMIEKSLIIIIFVYILSFSLLGAQYIWADVFHITLTDFNGNNLKNNLLTDIHTSTLNQITNSTLQTSPTSIISNVVGVTGGIMWDLVLLVTGTYIFDLLYQLGVPLIFVAGFIAVYAFLLIRSIAGWIRGI